MATSVGWTEPGCYEVAPGVLRIPLPMPQDGLRAVNVYVVDGGGTGLALIDAGWRVPNNLDVLAASLREVGHDVADVGDVFITHVHRDHYTLGPALRRHAGARIHLGAAERTGLTLVRQLGNNRPITSLEQLDRSGAGELAADVERLVADEPWDAGDWEDPDAWLQPGPLTIGGRRMEAVAVPGHTRGHLVFHDHDAGLLFTGDHVLPTISPSIGFELGEWDLPLADYLRSLELLLDRPDAEMMPAHGSPGGSVHARVRELLAHHRQRLEQIEAVLAGSTLTALEVASELLWTRRDRPFSSLDAFNQMIAVCETLAHLDLLVSHDVFSVEYARGIAWFQPR